ncbi:hypothetical protein Zmor_008143 [Zophobas morio]|uniref:Uncharacterized protein n=1 Tax=Zophobas morio TaxID=2755281 RepID=A0AA38IU47_9CUCU|nr:hypothetical protein Zmor_008143 [Zophobas morio]
MCSAHEYSKCARHDTKVGRSNVHRRERREGRGASTGVRGTSDTVTKLFLVTGIRRRAKIACDPQTMNPFGASAQSEI